MTAAELSAQRAVEESVMASTAIVERKTLTKTAGAKYSESWAVVGTIACDVWPINKRGDREATSAGAQLISRGDWYITAPYNADIRADDRLTIDNKTYELLFVPKSETWQTATRAEARTLNTEKR